MYCKSYCPLHPDVHDVVFDLVDEICDVFETEGVKADAHVYIGEPDEEIEKAAREHQASMIVLGSSGKTAWVERWLGSTPQSIAEKSIYPTLLIPFEQK